MAKISVRGIFYFSKALRYSCQCLLKSTCKCCGTCTLRGFWESFPDSSLCPGNIHEPKIQSLNIDCPPQAQVLEHLVPISANILGGFWTFRSFTEEVDYGRQPLKSSSLVQLHVFSQVSNSASVKGLKCIALTWCTWHQTFTTMVSQVP